ncbi:MAG: D-alanine--D-alanine ligase [Oscillospiraceae bacterium]|nr:D-alanine--D-alanine ligase [Oscillospiraceae bacterium]
MKIVVLAGGLSTERTVSLVSGQSVCKTMRKLGHRAVMVDMFLGIEDYEGDLEALFDVEDGRCGQFSILAAEPDLDAVRKMRKDKSPSLFGKNVLEICRMADLVFLGLHGACGEDGRVQATFDLLGIPYTGAGYLGSAMAMDKSVTKKFMDYAGIKTPAWSEFTYGEEDIPALAEKLPVPCAVKIVNGGSSIGVFLPDTREDLAAALREILAYGNHVIVEEKISGRELACAVLCDKYLPAVEIVPEGKYFDYVSKYQSGGAKEICPANITAEQQKEMGEMALALHRAMGVEVYSRSDFLLDENGGIWCLEINTLPGLTPASLLPKEAAAAGIEYETLCQMITEESLRIRGGAKW